MMTRVKELEDENRRLKKCMPKNDSRPRWSPTHCKKMVAPSHRREMAHRSVAQYAASIRVACVAFGISETCYRYCAKQPPENAEIADWLIRLTNNQRNWGFGLCYLYLRNVKQFK